MAGLHVAQEAQQLQRDARQRQRKHVSVQHLQLAYDRPARLILVLPCSRPATVFLTLARAQLPARSAAARSTPRTVQHLGVLSREDQLLSAIIDDSCTD